MSARQPRPRGTSPPPCATRVDSGLIDANPERAMEDDRDGDGRGDLQRPRAPAVQFPRCRGPSLRDRNAGFEVGKKIHGVVLAWKRRRRISSSLPHRGGACSAGPTAETGQTRHDQQIAMPTTRGCRSSGDVAIAYGDIRRDRERRGVPTGGWDGRGDYAEARAPAVPMAASCAPTTYDYRRRSSRSSRILIAGRVIVDSRPLPRRRLALMQDSPAGRDHAAR